MVEEYKYHGINHGRIVVFITVAYNIQGEY